MHQHFLDLGFRGTPCPYINKKKRVPQKILEIVRVFTTTATAATGRWPLHGERTTSAGAFTAGIHRRFAPEAKTTKFFLIFGEIPN